MDVDFLPPDLVAISAGDVEVHDARSGSMRAAQVAAFEIAITMVTARQWAAVSAGAKRGAASGPGVPVTGVTWFSALEYCQELSRVSGFAPAYKEVDGIIRWDPLADGYRLPTEAEWLRAATTLEGMSLNRIAWTDADVGDGPRPVGTKEASPDGVFDLLGNAWEWVWDYADPARYRDYRVLKGGGWADRAWSCRPGVRRASAPDAVLEDVGFRVARGPVVAQGGEFQGWSGARDRERANIRGMLPVGWTPYRELLAASS
ncbi:formylglycine-generating enzyme family protein [Demequina sediminicola]|uniref:formylglycine-generating enzyme family protein n=1 Tax=Demequina sediminicola TaxID=1095026 RepID=UPI000A9F731C|nr:SUMF1/EgtB/PvdO family nonheme iron enzyme [Demequina sediminicola]